MKEKLARFGLPAMSALSVWQGLSRSDWAFFLLGALAAAMWMAVLLYRPPAQGEESGSETG